jgi:hypothetical protein
MRCSQRYESALLFVRNNHGNAPPNQPPLTKRDILDLHGNLINTLLGHYGLPTAGNVSDRRWSLLNYLGIFG